MPPVRRNRQLTSSPEEVSSHYCYDDISVPAIQLNSLLLPPTSPEAHISPDASPPPPTKKKRSHGKAKPSGHIPRPPNAFILFRTEYIKSQVKQNSTPEVSKNLGQMWRNLSPSEKRPWIERAEEEKIMHKEKYPDYKYKPIHRRDEFGNCIRKPRSPNRPRMKKPPGNADMLDYLPDSFQWLEATPDAEFPNTELPSDTSSVSSPPPSPSPAPSLHRPPPSTFYLSHRRSSSVPLAGPDGGFLLGTAATSAYPSSPGLLTGHVRRLSKRPSTSMDFTCAGLGHSEMYPLANGAETYLFPNDLSPWRRQRRSFSAPDFGGEIPNFTFPCHSAPQEANLLTPINPVFGTMFDNFSWNTPQTSDTSSQNAQVNFAPTHSNSALSHKRMEYITVQIPSTTTESSTSNLSSITSPSVSPPSSQLLSAPTPSIQHPAPVATFNFSAFEEQMSQFEFDAAASQVRYEDPLGVVAQTCLPDAGTVYNVDEQYIVHPGDGRTAAAVQVVGSTAMQPSSDPAPIPRSADDQATDLQGYQEGVRYTRRCPEITPPRVLSFNELIVDSY